MHWKTMLLTCVLVGGLSSTTASAADFTLFAAVSTTNAMTEVVQLYEHKGFGKVRVSFGATSALARQIERGAPADVYLSADEKWMNYLQERKQIRPETRRPIIANTLAIIAPKDGDFAVKIGPGFPLVEALAGGRLAVGDPDHTAVGIYAKEALTHLGIWEGVEPRLARANSVRAGTVMVERGEVKAGIVFGTEAGVSDKVRLVDTFPAETHTAITYPIAITTNGNVDAGQEFLNFLRTPEVAAIFKKWGFVPQS